MIYEILIPLPPAGVTAHNSGHWRSKANKVKEYRETTRLLALGDARDGTIGYKVRISHVWHLGKLKGEKGLYYRPRDEANACQALKPAVDGLVDAGLLFDDSHEYVTWGEYVRDPGYAEDRKPGVVLWIEVLLGHPVRPKAKKVTK